MSHDFSTKEIRGKTGPVPNGAVLFGPFSWAYKKKDEEKLKDKIMRQMEMISQARSKTYHSPFPFVFLPLHGAEVH